MQTDKDLFDFIKESYPLQPREDFIKNTEINLRNMARKLDRKRLIKRFSFATSGAILCVISLSWLFFFNGIETVISTLTSSLDNSSASLPQNQKPLVFIYQTHSQESFLPEINETEPSKAIDSSKNITLVGKRLSKELSQKNVPNVHENKDIPKMLKEQGLAKNSFYKVSRQLLHDGLEKNKSIMMAFDIHRNSAKKDITTVRINGKDYARIEMIISGVNKNYIKNQEFALQIHKQLEERYPGLSRGVLFKSDTNNSYNQDLLNNSVLLEIGGVYNTLEEEYRTVDVFAGIIQEIIKNKKEN
jgi:stage II sporulation protein P